MMTKYTVFRKHQIPYEISSPATFSDRVAEFIELNEKLMKKNFSAPTDIVKALRRKWVSESASQEELREKRLSETQAYIQNIQGSPLPQLKILNGLFTGKEGPVRFRDCPIYIKDREERIIREFPKPEFLGELWRELETWEKENQGILSAFVLHFLVLSIHPFEDGNGRIARASEWIRLKELGFKFSPAWNSEVIMHWQASRYNDVLESCRSSGFVDEFISFMLDGYLETGRAYLLQR